MNAQAQIAQHLNVAENAIIEVQEWARVLWVRVRGIGARFVSKKVAKVEEQVLTVGKFGIKVINKAKVEIDGKVYDLTRFGLVRAGLSAKQIDGCWVDLLALAGRKNTTSSANSLSATSVKRSLNPEWVRYNNLNNEGCEGYNPYPKYI